MRVPHYFFRAEKKVSKKAAGAGTPRGQVFAWNVSNVSVGADALVRPLVNRRWQVFVWNIVTRIGRAGGPRPAANQSYTRTVLSLRGAQRATWQSPGRGTSATNLRRLTLVHRCHFERRRSRSREIPYERNETEHTRLIMKTAVGRRNDRFRFREIPTVTTFPRNDKLYGRVRRFIRLNIFKSSAHR